MMFADCLSYVAVVSREPEATVRRLGDLFGLALAELETDGGRVPAFALGRSSIIVVPPGHPLSCGRQRPGVDHIAIGVSDLTAAAAEAESRGIRRAGGELPGIDGARTILLSSKDLVGVRIVLTRPLALPPVALSPISGIDHVGVASADVFGVIAVFRDRLGLPLESTQTDVESALAVETFTSDRYGVVHHSRPARITGGLRIAFLTIGDCELEFLQNLDSGHSAEVDASRAGTTKQDQGAIARYIARHGPGLHHIALRTDDIDALLARADALGVPLIDRCGRPGSRRALIGFFSPEAFGGVLFHLVQRTEL